MGQLIPINGYLHSLLGSNGSGGFTDNDPWLARFNTVFKRIGAAVKDLKISCLFVEDIKRGQEGSCLRRSVGCYQRPCCLRSLHGHCRCGSSRNGWSLESDVPQAVLRRVVPGNISKVSLVHEVFPPAFGINPVVVPHQCSVCPEELFGAVSHRRGHRPALSRVECILPGGDIELINQGACLHREEDQVEVCILHLLRHLMPDSFCSV